MVPLVKCIWVYLGLTLIAAFSEGRENIEVNEVKSISKRTTSNTHFVNLLFYIDYQIYTRFYSRTTGSSEIQRVEKTEEEIKKYYILYAKSMNSIYSGINSSHFKIQISLVDIHISNKSESWISLTSDNYLATGIILDNFYSQLKNYKYGHAMLITGHEIISSTREMVAGRAEFNSICQTDKKSVSVVVDKGGFQSVKTACHELAHSLGVEHDSGKSGCLESDQYIMAGNTTNVNINNKFNPWKFSSCSVQYIESTLGSIMSLSSEEQRCLTEKQPSNIDQSSVENLQPGQVYTPDQQCQMIWRSDSFYHRDGTLGSNICTNMKCRNDTNYIEYIAAEGTSCGSKKWCQLGHCVPSEEAPDKSEKCLFGDIPSQMKQIVVVRRVDGQGRNIADRRELTCSGIAQSFPYLCYVKKITSLCCSSCGEIATSVTGCEYGDKIQNCLKSNCDHIYSDGYVPAKLCCGTCNLKSPFVCRDLDAECDSVRTGVATRCYDTNFAFRCCKTCERARDLNATDCVFGDRDTNCDVITKNGSKNCDIYKEQCCRLCTKEVTSSGHRAICGLSFVVIWTVIYLRRV